RLLGAQRLRRRRLGRPQQRPRRRTHMNASDAATTRLPRFDRVERYAHWCTATLMLVLLFTGFAMYVGPLSTLVGRRLLMRNVHLYSGLLLPIPIVVAICLRAGAQLRIDLGRLNRWTADDRAWWSKRR